MIKKYALFICDLQTKTVPSLFYKNGVITNVNKLLHMKGVLPVFDTCISSVFIPEKLGVIDKSVHKKNIDMQFRKTTYSMIDHEVGYYLINNKITDVVLTGMETQWCIQRTATDLSKRGITVHIPVDAIGNALSHTENIYNIQHLQSNKNVILGTTDSMICSHLYNYYDTASKEYLKSVKLNRNQPHYKHDK